MKIAVVGAGYVGLSIAVLLAQNHDVMVLDINEQKVNLINNKVSPLKDREISDFLRNKDLKVVATTVKKPLTLMQIL